MTAPNSKRPARRADVGKAADPDIDNLLEEERAAADELLEPSEVTTSLEEVEPLPEIVKTEGVSKPTARPRHVLVIHFLDDGFTAMGKVWYRGEELRIEEGTEEWEACHDENGYSWLNDDKWRQQMLYGRHIFDQGPWMGEGFDLDDPTLTEEQRATLRRIWEKRMSRESSIGVTPERQKAKNLAFQGGSQKKPTFLNRG